MTISLAHEASILDLLPLLGPTASTRGFSAELRMLDARVGGDLFGFDTNVGKIIPDAFSIVKQGKNWLIDIIEVEHSCKLDTAKYRSLALLVDGSSRVAMRIRAYASNGVLRETFDEVNIFPEATICDNGIDYASPPKEKPSENEL